MRARGSPRRAASNPAKSHHASEASGLFRGSAPGRNRTCDLALRRRTLYPLSYRRAASSLARVEVTARVATLQLAEMFVISRESTETAEVVQAEIRHGGVSGFGEGAPIERYGE